MPFPSPADVPDQDAAAQAALALIAIVDDARGRSDEPFSIQIDEGEILRTIDRLAYQYFCLSPDEIALIDNTVEAILPALQPHEDYAEDAAGELSDVLEQLAAHINRPLDGNFQLMPDLRVFVGDCRYLIKPMQLRFWLRSTALADAGGIALDLQQAAAVPQRRVLIDADR